MDQASIKAGIIGLSEGDKRFWELATQVPQLSLVWAYVCLALNIILPGVGTMLSACLGDSNINKT